MSPPPDPEAAPLRDAVARIAELYTEKERISPAWLATEAMILIAFPRELHPTGYLGCHLQMRQIARAYCRKRFDKDDDDEQPDLFNGTLQKRYPKAHNNGDDPEYILLAFLTDQDIAFNVARLRMEANAKLDHADALEAWGKRKFLTA